MEFANLYNHSSSGYYIEFNQQSSASDLPKIHNYHGTLDKITTDDTRPLAINDFADIAFSNECFLEKVIVYQRALFS